MAQQQAQQPGDSSLSAIGIYARVRPGGGGDELEVKRNKEYEPRSVQVRNLEFSLDWVFDGGASQQDVYEQVGKRRVARVVEGFNVCLLAYGQTGSGKTHTMYGSDETLSNLVGSREADHGLALRAISDLFKAVGGPTCTHAPCMSVRVNRHRRFASATD